MIDLMERPMRIELTPEPWQVCKERSIKDLRGGFESVRCIWSGQKPLMVLQLVPRNEE